LTAPAVVLQAQYFDMKIPLTARERGILMIYAFFFLRSSIAMPMTLIAARADQRMRFALSPVSGILDTASLIIT